MPDLDLPLGFLHRPGSAPRWLAAPDGGWGRLRGYCGAAAVDSAAGLIAMSSPRGNCVGLWDESGAALEALAIHDGCGLSATGTTGEILVSSGSGELFSASREAGSRRCAAPTASSASTITWCGSRGFSAVSALAGSISQ